MTKTIFTFGSDPRYPFGPNDYVEIEAEDINQACLLFQAVHPNRPGSDCVNCAFFYSEQKFNEFRDLHYRGVEPIETITVRRRA